MKRRMQILRERRGWSRADLSRVATLGAPRTSAFELGRATPASDSAELRRVALALGWPIDDAGALLDEIDE